MSAAYLNWVLCQASGWRVVVVVGVLLVSVDARAYLVRDLVVVGEVMVDRSFRVE